MSTKYSTDIFLNNTVANKNVFRDPPPKYKAQRETKGKFEEWNETGKNALPEAVVEIFFVSVIKSPKK